MKIPTTLVEFLHSGTNVAWPVDKDSIIDCAKQVWLTEMQASGAPSRRQWASLVCVTCQVSHVTCNSQTIRNRELKFQESVHPPPRVTCPMSLVICHVSDVKCHLSYVNHKVPPYLQFQSICTVCTASCRMKTQCFWTVLSRSTVFYILQVSIKTVQITGSVDL